MNKINAEIIADSVNEHGNRITTYVLTYPRIIHAELLTHRLFSRNAASSRAIPASKMIKDIEKDPFIPVAWQKAHSGMQGTEYFDDSDILDEDLSRLVCKGKPTLTLLNREYYFSMQKAVESAKKMLEMGGTKQLVNRILEPYQWYTCIVTATEYDNFFELRCPQYEYGEKLYKSRKDIYAAPEYTQAPASEDNGWIAEIEEKPKYIDNDLDWLKLNKGAGEIHISLLAEAMWDARNESEPKQLKAGKWHIPFGENLDRGLMRQYVPDFSTCPSEMTNMFNAELDKIAIKIATARAARVSYLNFEGKDDYEADIKLYDRLLEMGHMSPFEHCARAMSSEEHNNHFRGDISKGSKVDEWHGWSGNFRGFVQLRKEIE